MRKVTFGLILLNLIAAAFVQTVAIQTRTRPYPAEAAQSYGQRGYYNQNGTRYYDGYPLSDWDKMRDRW